MSGMSVRQTSLFAALALAAQYIPEIHPAGESGTRVAGTFDHAAFFLSGKYRAWSGWDRLEHAEKQRIAQVLAIADDDLSDARTFATEARALLAPLGTAPAAGGGVVLAPFELAGDDPFRASAAFPRVGGDLLGYVDRIIKPFRRPSARPKAADFAGPGVWNTGEIFVKDLGQISGQAIIPTFPGFTEAFGHERLPEVSTAEYLETLRIPTAELLHLASVIDKREPQPYLHDRLQELFDVLKTTDDIPVAEALRMTAGGMEVFHAPTGTGKSVLVRVAASWFASKGLRAAIVLPDIKACLAMTRKIQLDLQHLEAEKELKVPSAAAHLMSSYGMHDKALHMVSLITEDPDAPGVWGDRGEQNVDPLAYDCALKTFMASSGDYPAGREPCLSLHGGPDGASACPWIPTCGKFAPVYDACQASVVVMNHFVFMQGNLRIGVVLDGRPVRSMTAAEFALRTCHALFVDEADQFQSRAVERCAANITLHSRRHWSAAPHEIDTDAKRLRIDDEHNLVPSVSHTRLMAESVLLGVCQSKLSLHAAEDERAALRIPDATSSRWHMARSRDRPLIRLLWPQAENFDDDAIPAAMSGALESLMPARFRRTDPLAAPTRPMLDGWEDGPWQQVQAALAALVAPRGEHMLDEVKLELHTLLAPLVDDPYRRAQAINLLVVRTMLLELDVSVALLQRKAYDYRTSGLRSAQKIADRLARSAVLETMPTGMLGRSITGYRVSGLDDPEKSAALLAQTIAGDPHMFTAELGGVVALRLAGCQRPVMGLSATGFFPQAVREHLHAPVRWWMTDAQANSIRARRHRIDYGPDHPMFGEPIKIAGTFDMYKKGALIELGSRLHEEYLHPDIQRTLASRNDSDRAHLLVVANSYAQCAALARGISQSGSFEGGLCLAVRAEDRLSADPDLPPASIATRLSHEEYEDFPRHGRILVVPLSLVARGLNIVKGTRSAVRSVYLCVRPPAILTEPAQLYGSVNAAGMWALPPGGSADPAAALGRATAAAWDRLALLLRTAPQFSSMHRSLQEELVAGMIVNLIQLAGRARRGGTEAVLHLVDYAFHDDMWSSDLGTILGRIHAKWPPDVRAQMNNLYGGALEAFLHYAGIDPDRPFEPGIG